MTTEHRLETAIVFDTGPLDELLAILGEDGSVIVGEILDAYLAEAPRLVARIDDGARTQNLVTIRDAAHTLKSASTNVGAIALSRCCDLAEQAARLGDSTVAVARCRELTPLFDETVARIENWWQ
jgi:HPt (histidine-containing phosphotransfer) domain-containing protein